MNRFSHFVTEHKKIVLAIFSVIAAVCIVLASMVSVNYKLVDYLPKDSQSTIAISIMEDEFGGQFPNARVMVEDVTVREALEMKTKIAAIDGVSSVSWLDDVVGASVLSATPVEYLDSSIAKNYYKDKSALFSVAIESGKEETTVAAIHSVIGEQNALAGEAVNTATAQEMSTSQVQMAMGILLPVIIIILILTTTSWLEPLLFLLAIGLAVLINMGTNIFFGEVSYITNTISPILQLAVSLDYAIFLLHSFTEFRQQHEPHEAMRRAMKKSLAAVAASAATTVIGFLALIFMRFGIGFDLGLNLVKGVLLSFVSVMVFLPALTLMTYKFMDKTRHRKLIPSFQNSGKFLMKIRIPFLILAMVVVIPCFLAQTHIEFKYGTDSIAKASQAGTDAENIEQRFGKENQLALLVPRGNVGKEIELCDTLSNIPHVTGVISYVTAVGGEIPSEYLSAEIVKQFYSKNYSRIILYTDMAIEGSESFATIQSVLDAATQQYDSYYLAGQSATLYDMKNVVSIDTKVVNLIAIIGIFLVLLITFRSLTLPFILVFTIETAIWINLSFAYFSGLSFNFIGYLVISTVQLGATVDYAILLTDRYIGNRKEMGKKEAMKATIVNNIIAIITSASILSMAGFTLALTSSNPIISELGTLLGRGTLLSVVMVACVLPAFLMLFDRAIEKTTLNNRFHIAKKND